MGVGLLAYICSGDCCAIKHEHSGLSLGIMEDGYYSSGITIGILTTFAVIRLLPAIVKWADSEIIVSTAENLVKCYKFFEIETILSHIAI